MSKVSGVCRLCDGEGFTMSRAGEEVVCRCQTRSAGKNVKRRGAEVLDPSVIRYEGIEGSYEG
jgi:hypothetical protein